MKRNRFSESQIVKTLKETEAGIPVEGLSRQSGFSRTRYSKWKAKYSGMDASALKRLRELEGENQKLKEMDANLSLEYQVLKAIVEKKVRSVAERRELVEYAMTPGSLSERQACQLLQISRSVHRYQAKASTEFERREALMRWAARQPRWGVQKMIDYFKNQG